MKDKTAPVKGYPAPGPRLNISPRRYRGIAGILRYLTGGK